MDREWLDDLRGEWRKAVLEGRPYVASPFIWRPACWFGTTALAGADECEGRVEGAHWIKRQRVEKTIAQQLGLPELVVSPKWQRRWRNFPAEYPDLELLFLAAWDPRNGVPACEKHHKRFDGHRADATSEFIVWRHEVPDHVEEFCADWGLETALEDRNPVTEKEI